MITNKHLPENFGDTNYLFKTRTKPVLLSDYFTVKTLKEFENYGVYLYNNESELKFHNYFDYKGHRDNLPKELLDKLSEDFRLKYDEEWIVLMMK